MKTRILPLAFIAVLLLAFGAIAAACGGGGEPLTLEEYFQRLQALSDDLDERGEALDEEFDEQPEAAESEEAMLEALRELARVSRPLFVDLADGIADLNPPEQVEDAHRELEQASADILTAFDNFFDRLEDLESTADLEDLSEEESFVDAGERFEQACFDLEEIARENDIDVDLNCEG